MKYGNKWTWCISGHLHQSGGEAKYCNKLFFMKHAGKIKDYETQVSVDLIVNDQLIAKHKVDFYVTLPDGEIEIHEYKGKETALWKLKKKLFNAIYPFVKYIVVKEK